MLKEKARPHYRQGSAVFLLCQGSQDGHGRGLKILGYPFESDSWHYKSGQGFDSLHLPSSCYTITHATLLHIRNQQVQRRLHHPHRHAPPIHGRGLRLSPEPHGRQVPNQARHRRELRPRPRLILLRAGHRGQQPRNRGRPSHVQVRPVHGIAHTTGIFPRLPSISFYITKHKT